MRVAIIEDELFAFEELKRMLQHHFSDIEIVAHYDSVQSAVRGLPTLDVDLTFFDISLPDGQSFEILEQMNADFSIIFTTAYDEYAIRAFKYNSVDYLLKPVDADELVKAVDKYRKQRKNTEKETYARLARYFEEKQEKKRFLIKVGDKYSYITIGEIAYFYSEDKLSFIRSFNDSTYIVDYSLNEIEQMLGDDFFRVSRNMICSLKSIRQTSKFFNSRLKLILDPAFDDEVLISRKRVKDFLDWMDG